MSYLPLDTPQHGEPHSAAVNLHPRHLTYLWKRGEGPGGERREDRGAVREGACDNCLLESIPCLSICLQRADQGTMLTFMGFGTVQGELIF